MSAPEKQVRVETREWKGRTEYRWTCDGCRWHPYLFWTMDPEPPPSVALHNDHCDSLALARLQARWDARDDTLRALIEQWGKRALSHVGESVYGEGQATELANCADELERAIGGGKS